MPAKRTPSAARRLLGLALPFRWWMLLAAVLGFATIGSSIGLMSAAAWIIASAALHPPIGELQVAIVGVRFFGIARGVFRYAERVVSHQTAFRLLARLRVWFYEGVEPLAPAGLQERRSGDLLARAVADVDTLENFFLRVIAPPAVALLTAAVMAVFFAAYGGRMALALVAWMALAGVGVPLLVQRLSRKVGYRLVTTRSSLANTLIDGVQGMADLVAYGAADRQFARVQALNRQHRRQQAHIARVGALAAALHSLIITLALLTTLVIAIPLVQGGRLDGVLLAVLALATITAFEAVQPLPAAAQHLGANLAAARRLFEIVDAPPVVSDPLHPVKMAAAAASLSIRDLRFRYGPDEPPALDGVTFDLPAGATVAVVGASGAGKTTLVNVLLRFWDYREGTIMMGGHDLHEYAADDVRARFAVVSQRTHLFNATLRDNLRLARPDAEEADLIRALDGARLADFVLSLPAGLDTWIGEHGLTLSGGERQRLAVARAILKPAPFLILDEPTAHLDPATERAVLDTIFTALASRTTLLITHRLAGLDRADTILVMRAGRIVARGTHTGLLEINGPHRPDYSDKNSIWR